MPGDRRADHARDVDQHGVEADGVAQVRRADHLQHERLPRRVLEAVVRCRAAARARTPARAATVPVIVSRPSTSASTPITACSPIISRRLSMRSATTPPYGPSSRIGRVCRATTSAERGGRAGELEHQPGLRDRSASRCRRARRPGRGCSGGSSGWPATRTPARRTSASVVNRGPSGRGCSPSAATSARAGGQRLERGQRRRQSVGLPVRQRGEAARPTAGCAPRGRGPAAAPARGGRLDERGAPVVRIGAAVQQARVLELADDPGQHRGVDALDLGQLGDPHRAEPPAVASTEGWVPVSLRPRDLPVEHPRDAGQCDLEPGDLVVGERPGHATTSRFTCLSASIRPGGALPRIRGRPPTPDRKAAAVPC